MNGNDVNLCDCYGSIEAVKQTQTREKRYESHTMSDPSQPYYFHLDNRYVMPHWHENIEILHYHGDASVICDREKYTVNTHDIAIFGSNTLHAAHKNGDTVYDCLIIDSEFLLKNGIDVAALTFRCVVRDEYIEELFLRVGHEVRLARDGAPFGSSAVKAAILTLATELCRRYSQPDEGGRVGGGAIKRAIGYIKNHLDERLSIDTIAGSVNMSKYYFCREFHRETGFTVVKYINNLRCREAQKLIEEGKYSISQVARLCGFENASYFSRIYKQMIGETPTESVRGGEND